MKPVNQWKLYLRSVILLAFVVLCRIDLSTGDDVFASAAQIQLLDKGEMDLADALRAYLDSEFWRLNRLQE